MEPSGRLPDRTRPACLNSEISANGRLVVAIDMDINPGAPVPSMSDAGDAVSTGTDTTGGATTGPSSPSAASGTAAVVDRGAALARVRSLRARPSAGGAAPAAMAASGVRKPSDADLELIKRRLGPVGVAERRDELVHEKEAAVKGVVDEHDTALRELFHLERFVTMITGWNPVVSFSHCCQSCGGLAPP